MKCPQCDGEAEPVAIRAVSGRSLQAKRCSQCSGIWFPKPFEEQLDYESVKEVDAPRQNYSMAQSDFVCPNDRTLLDEADSGMPSNIARRWVCPECHGVFFPRGQLGLFAQWQATASERFHHVGLHPRTQGALASLLVLVLVAGLFASINTMSSGYFASTDQPLPTAGPNVFALSLLAITYLAGTILAVLGRRLPLIIAGWSVIAVCLFGFSIIIFGP